MGSHRTSARQRMFTLSCTRLLPRMYARSTSRSASVLLYLSHRKDRTMREQRGNPYQTPVTLRTNAPRQTEKQVLTRSQSRQPRTPRGADEEIGDGWTGDKSHTSAIRYDRPSRRETTRLPQAPATKVITYRRFTLARFLVIVGLLLFLLALGITAFNAISNWWQLHTDDATYGTPRTFQTDQYVGHGDSPTHPDHFIAVNLSGIVEV